MSIAANDAVTKFLDNGKPVFTVEAVGVSITENRATVLEMSLNFKRCGTTIVQRPSTDIATALNYALSKL